MLTVLCGVGSNQRPAAVAGAVHAGEGFVVAVLRVQVHRLPLGGAGGGGGGGGRGGRVVGRGGVDGGGGVDLWGQFSPITATPHPEGGARTLASTVHSN